MDGQWDECTLNSSQNTLVRPAKEQCQEHVARSSPDRRCRRERQGQPKKGPRAVSLRKRLASSPAANRMIAAGFRAWLRFVRATSRCEADGWPAVVRLIERHGAVIIVCWHQRIMLTPWMFDLSVAPCRSLTSTGRAGRLVGWLHHGFGYESTPIRKGTRCREELRLVLNSLKQGVSLGISPDGPQGPARVAKIAPIQWARSAQVPIVVFTYAATRFWRLGTWDRLMIPKPFGRLAFVWRRWEQPVPARFSEAEAARLAQDLGEFMNAVTEEADVRIVVGPRKGIGR